MRAGAVSPTHPFQWTAGRGPIAFAKLFWTDLGLTSKVKIDEASANIAGAVGCFVNHCISLVSLRPHESDSSLAQFSSKISTADAIELRGPHVKVALTNFQIAAAVKIISAGRRDLNSYQADFSEGATFLCGTNFLGSIRFCGDVFLIDGKQYRDTTGLFEKEISQPIMAAYEKFYDDTNYSGR